jgi:hypothetical protein
MYHLFLSFYLNEDQMAKKIVNSMPEKTAYKKSDLKKAVGCRVTVGYPDKPAVTGVLMPNPVENGYVLLTVNKKGKIDYAYFDSAAQIISIDATTEPALRMMLDSASVIESNEALCA